VRWLVAGYGDVVVRRAVPALIGLGHEVVIWGRRPERATQTASSLGVEAADHFESALRRADVVYVATPVAAHLPPARLAAAAGRPVLLEKPVTGGLTAATGLDSVTVGVAYYRRLSPGVQRLRALLAQERPLRAEVDFAAPFEPVPGDPMHWRTVSAVSGGGVLADAGCHRLDLLSYLLGRPATVRAALTGRHPGGAERVAEVCLGWPDGRTARVSCAWRPTGRTDRFAIGTGRRILALDPLDGDRLSLGAESEPLPTHDPHRALFTDFAEAVEHGRDPVCPLADGLVVDRILAAAHRSAGADVRL
jgi:predicted dehydrogenase